jgi:hypothetical protein
MNTMHRVVRFGLAVLLLATGGCTSLREIPRHEYAARSERKNVSVDTREGLHYDFDYVKVGSDTLMGYHRRDNEGSFEEFDAVPLPLEAISKFSARKVDWYRTGLVGGAGVAAAIFGAIAHNKSGEEPPSSDPGGVKGGP